MFQKAGAPTGLGVGPELPTGSTISLAWDLPLDTGGGRILYYLVSYTVTGQPEAEDRTPSDAAAHKLAGLRAQTAVSGISVRAVTEFGAGARSGVIEAATTRTTRPMPPTQLRVAAVAEASVAVEWTPSADTGGEPLVRQTIAYELGGVVRTVQLDAAATAYTIAGLSGATAVDGIAVSADNSAGSSAPSAAVSARTVNSQAPTISALADTTTLAGEATSPQAFTVGDAATASAALTVRAASSNAELVPPSAVAIGGIGALRFVVVTPVEGNIGAATITLSVTNEAGLTSGTQFQVTVEESWQAIHPTISYATGGSPVTVSGAGFSSDSDYTCRFSTGSMVASSPAALRSGAELVCTAPAWPYVALGVRFTLLKGAALLRAGARGESAVAPVEFIYREVWVASAPSVAAAVGGTRVSITGAGFDASSAADYACIFSAGALFLTSSDVALTDSETLTCELPPWGASFTAGTVMVSLRHSGVLVPTATAALRSMLLTELWSGTLAPANPLTVSAEGGYAVTVRGSGFDTAARVQYQCVFTSDCCGLPPCAAGECTSVSALGVYAASSTAIVCVAPPWGDLQAYSGAAAGSSVYTTLTVLNTDVQRAVHSTAASLARFEFEEVWRTVFPRELPITGGQVTIFGTAFDTACATSSRGCYMCAYSRSGSKTMYGAAVACSDASCRGALAVPTSTKEVSCAFPRWSVANSAGIINVQLLHARGAVVKHATASLPARGTLEDTTFITSESWFSVAPSTADMAAATTLTVQGAGFETNADYRCRLTTRAALADACESAEDCYAGADPLCAAAAACVNSRCTRTASWPVAGPPQDIFNIECTVNSTLWAGCFAATTAQLTVERATDAGPQLVQFGGGEGADGVLLPEVIFAAAPLTGNKFGFTTITVDGASFDVGVKYVCRFTYLTTSVDSLEVFPESASSLTCISPNWASLSGLGGSGALTSLTLRKVLSGETVSPLAPINFNFV